MHVKYTNVLYFSKESILQGTHARPDWFAPNIQKKIGDIWVHEMKLDAKYTKLVYFQRNLYSRELTRGRAGSLEHP